MLIYVTVVNSAIREDAMDPQFMRNLGQLGQVQIQDAGEFVVSATSDFGSALLIGGNDQIGQISCPPHRETEEFCSAIPHCLILITTLSSLSKLYCLELTIDPTLFSLLCQP